MFIDYRQIQIQNFMTFKNELRGYFIGNIMRMMPPFIQCPYDAQCYNNAQNTLNNQFSTQYEQACAIKTIAEIDYMYAI